MQAAQPETPSALPCPSCHAPMRTLRLGGQHDTEIVLDLCFACHGIWFDRRENLLLSPDGV